MLAKALSIAGSDPSGGAGLQADLKVFQRFGIYGYGFATLNTLENSQAVQGFEALSEAWLAQTFAFVVSDIAPDAVKVGALGSAAAIQLVGEWLRKSSVPWVIDPIHAATRGATFANDSMRELYIDEVLP